MRLLRRYAAIALLRVAGVIAGPDLLAGLKPTHHKTGSMATRFHPAGHILLASLTGLAICIVWIWINGRAWR